MFTHYTGNQQFDLQLNRAFEPILDRREVQRAAEQDAPHLRSTHDITSLAYALARTCDAAGDPEAAWRLYALSAFYIPSADPRKRDYIAAMSRAFDEAHHGLGLTRHSIPYRDGELTAMRWEADTLDRAQAPAGSPRTLLMMIGFDGYAVEIIDFASYFPTRPFDIIAFDGPGQGHTALAGMTLEPE